MPNFSQITVIGHVGREPESRHLNDGTAVTSFSVAFTRKVKGSDHTTWFQVSAFGKLAEIASQYVKKGAPVQVVGEFSAREWATQEGEKRTALEIRADKLTLLGGKQEGGETESAPAPKAAAKPKQSDFPADAGNLDDDSIPF